MHQAEKTGTPHSFTLNIKKIKNGTNKSTAKT
jgi:hypothetical protein